MLPLIARHLIYPVHESLLGRDTFAYLRGLEQTQWFAPDDLQAIQRSKLRALLDHAEVNTPFYRQRIRDADIDVMRDHPLDCLRRLPLLDKPTISASREQMLWRDAPGGVFPHDTGGSTGQPLMFYFDRRRQGFDQAARIRTHRWFGVDAGDVELYLWGAPNEHRRGRGIKRLRDGLFNHRLLNAFDMSPARMDDYLDEWDRAQPACLFGYPSSIALFVEHARSKGRQLNVDRLRAVFVTGEVCHPHQREAISSYFGAPVANGYGSREAGFIAHECPEGSMHLTAENVVVEIVGDDGELCSVGTSGEIVVTHLDAYAMPFIRYRTGDVGRLKLGRCACGRGLPMLDVVEGRATDFLYLPDGTVRHALSIIYPLRATPGVRQFRVTQQENYGVVVEVVADDREEKISVEAVTRSVRPVVGGEVSLDVRLVDTIELTGSGKHRYVLSKVDPLSPSPRKPIARGSEIAVDNNVVDVGGAR